MEAIIKINDLSFSYDDKVIFKNLNLDIKENTITTIVGPNSCGKTTLVKILSGNLKYNGNIIIDGKLLNKENINDLRMKVCPIFDALEQSFVAETVIDEMAFVLENLCYPKNDIKKEINRVSKLLEIKKLLEHDPNSLTEKEKQLVSLGCFLVLNPKIIIVDDFLENKEIIFRKLKQLGITIINVTCDLNDCLFSDDIVVLNNKKVFKKGSKEEVFKDADDLEKIGLKIPFMIDLSKKLQFYDLIDEDIFSMNEMVEKLWK